jgi:hypothetical protein
LPRTLTQEMPMLLSTPTRSLKHEYATYVDLEIERYKDSIPRTALLKLADDAVASMSAGDQLELSELVLVDAVNELIMRRLKLPNYDRWRRNRLKRLEQFRRADHWGMSATQRLVDAVRPQEHPHVVVAGPHVEQRTLYLAAHGAHVTAIGELDDEELVAKVLVAAAQAGLSGQVVGCADGLDEWSPVVPVRAVIWHAQVLDALSPEKRARVLAHLQNATAAGGMHYIEGVSAESRHTASIRSLIANYVGWQSPADTGDGVIVLHKPRVA